MLVEANRTFAVGGWRNRWLLEDFDDVHMLVMVFT
jgi:hypothetical protein